MSDKDSNEICMGHLVEITNLKKRVTRLETLILSLLHDKHVDEEEERLHNGG